VPFVAVDSLADSYVGLFTFRELRRFVVRSHGVMMTVFVALAYGLLAMLQAGMLVFVHLAPPYYVTILWGSPFGYQPWNFPGLIAVAPWGIVELPLWGTFSMVFVTVGVAIGMTSAVLLAVALLRRRTATAGGPTSVGALAGLTPAMIGLLALGGCCSTTAAATAGVGVIAQVTGTTETNLLVNNWYLSVFQRAVVWVSLLAQEMLLRVYGHLFDPALGVGRRPSPARWDRRTVAGGVFRASLMVGGLAWILTAMEAWTTVAPGAASATLWFDWLALHFVPGGLALAAALVPAAFVRWFGAARRSAAVAGARVALFALGALLVAGVPPPFAAAGAVGLGNELLSLFGVAPAWGGVAPALGVGGSTFFRWTFEYLLLGGFALFLGLRPRTALAPLAWSARDESTRPRPDPSLPTEAPAPGPA
jgi:hypothetical protein